MSIDKKIFARWFEYFSPSIVLTLLNHGLLLYFWPQAQNFIFLQAIFLAYFAKKFFKNACTYPKDTRIFASAFRKREAVLKDKAVRQAIQGCFSQHRVESFVEKNIPKYLH